MKLQANFFKIELNKNTPNYFHYNIDIKKAEDKKNAPRKDATPKSKKTPKHLNNLIFAELFRKNKSVFQTSILPAFDGEKVAIVIDFCLLLNINWILSLRTCTVCQDSIFKAFGKEKSI